MPYVVRGANGIILSVHRHPVPGGEFIAPEDGQLREFIGGAGGSAPADASFAKLDADLIRVVEDLIDVLIARQVIRITDLPVEAQDKLFARKSYRERGMKNALRLYEGDDEIVQTDFGGL